MAVLAAMAAVGLCEIAAAAAPAKLLRFPNVWHDRVVFSYGGNLWTVGGRGGTAIRLTSNPGLDLFARFSPDGRFIAFTGQYGGDEQVYVIPAEGGVPKQLTFYPAAGPLAERWGFDNQVYGWTPDGAAILFRSARDGAAPTDRKLYTVPVQGGAATPLPMPRSGAGDFSPDGGRIVYSPLWRDFRSEKRYQGGWANDLYIFDLRRTTVAQITSDPHTDRDPMWIGDAIYFNSDRTGVFNLFRYDLATRVTTQLTDHRDWDVRWPSADASGQIVYELGGELHVYDTRDATDRALPIVVPADSTATSPQTVNAADNIESLTLSPGGERVGIVARGDVFSVPVEQGVTRNLTRSSFAHERELAWSRDGRQLAYVSDRSGEEEIYVQAQDGSQPAVQLTFGSKSRYYAPQWSGDDKRIAYCDNTGRLFVLDLSGRRRVVVARDPQDLAQDYRWSPDGQYLSYSLNDSDGVSGVYVWSVADGESHRITPPFADARSPAWAPAGDMLYFLSDREYRPMLSSIEFDFATDRRTGIFAVTLRKDVKNPFGLRDDEYATARDEEGMSRRRSSPLKIDFEGIEARALRVPLDADDLSGLQAGEDDLLYERSGPVYLGRDSSIKSSVMSYSFKDREAKPVLEDVTAWSASADGRHVVARLASNEIQIADVGKSEDAKPVPLAGLVSIRVPAAEWREIFSEVWRRYRDYFYDGNMHGYDWERLREKYQPLVDSAACRSDLNYVISEMIAELTVQHAYIEGGDLGLPKRPFVALPGARFELDVHSGRYRIAGIFAGQNEEENYRSPLTEVNVDAHVGDYVLAINGRELAAGTDPYELLRAAPQQPVEWRVAPGADGRGAHTIRYQPLSSENSLRYLAWVSANRARVERLSGGRLGYLHLPDMGEAGMREFIKWWYPQVRKEGMLIDVRANAGGNISELLIARLARTLQGMSFGRNRSYPGTYPRVLQPGPKVALIDEQTASDGELFARAFRRGGIGALIGKRTWGGAVSYTDHGPLLDGGAVFVPEFGNTDENGRWIIEGRGVDPDIVVDQDPVAVLQGHDPQLERGVQELMRQLPPTPAGVPRSAPAPVKTGAP
jgi:tricorn protease